MKGYAPVMESPLDVLSRAASLMNEDRTKDPNSDTQILDDSVKVSTLSSENRRKRNLERRDLTQALSFSETHFGRNSTKTAGTQTSPLSPVPKSRMDIGPPPLISLKGNQEEMDQIQTSVTSRPSVITSTKVIQHPVGFMPQQMYNSQHTGGTGGFHRREIVESGAADPFVEEHFRRSLGDDYIRVSPVQKTVSGSVDEHFAKALGDKWNQINSPKTTTATTTHMQSLVLPTN